VPFHDVIVHATIQAGDGRRMSKSLGTGIDPREVIDRYGADALRAWGALIGMASQDARFDETRIKGFRGFSTKLWNATRLVLSSIAKEPPQGPPAPDGDLQPADRWILSRLQQTIELATSGIEEYAFQRSIEAAYDFAWHEFCDWYLEAAKSRLKDGDPSARATSLFVLDNLFRLLHPFLPFISEELWHRLPGERDFLVREPWPVADPRFRDAGSEAAFEGLIRLVEEIRAARQAQASGSRGGRLWLGGETTAAFRELVADLARVELVAAPLPGSLPLTWGDARLELPARVDDSRRRAEVRRVEEDLAKVEAKLGNPAFRDRAPAEIVAKEERKAAELRGALKRLREGRRSAAG